MSRHTTDLPPVRRPPSTRRPSSRRRGPSAGASPDRRRGVRPGGVDGFGDFLRRAEHRVLSAAEERALGARIAAGRRAAGELAALGDTAADRRAALVRLVADGERAARELADHNIRLVVSVAKRYRSETLDLDDLVQEGYIGLLRAVEKFDHTRGYKFSTYAVWWIRQAIGRALTDQGPTIRIPANAAETLRRVRAVRDMLVAENGDASHERIAAEVGVPERTVADLLVLDIGTGSLDETVGEGSTSVAELVPGPEDPEAEALQRVRSREVEELLAVLPAREATILRRRFGLGDDRCRTLEEVAGELGISRERVRQLERRALARLRDASGGWDVLDVAC